MKNLIIIIMFVLLCLITTNLNAQLPLQYGDAVVTHSKDNRSGYGNLDIVVRTIKTSNTSLAPLGVNWNTSFMSPVGTKPKNENYPNWTYDNLGPVFGITLDTRSNPNIYVSSTQVHAGYDRIYSEVWRLDGTTGAHTLVYNFNNANRSLGNLKYKKIGGIENIYVSNFENGAIERLIGNSSTSNNWARQAAFIPKFGEVVANANFIPYGLAVRNMQNNTFKLFYTKTSILNPFTTNEIWSIELNNNGEFIGVEQKEDLITLSLKTSNSVISDIAFKENGKSILIGQQTWYSPFSLSAHKSNVVELDFDDASNSWVDNGNVYPAGMSNGSNCVGGVSYSDNILNGNSTQFSCDTTVAFSTDAIVINGPLPYSKVYGMQLMHNRPGNALSNSICIDQDDEILISQDKYRLGDIEVYKNPQVCKVTCKCGSWSGIDLTSDTSWWNNTNNSMPPTPAISFNQGEAQGVLFLDYNCSSSCGATYPYTVTNSQGNIMAQPINNNDYISLEAFNKSDYECGSYFINITPECDGNKCEEIQIPVVIVCPPQCLDCGGKIEVSRKEVKYDEKGFINTNFSISNDNPITEVRVLVEEFRVISENGNENCLLCKNTPKTWGSIQRASLAGINYKGSSSSIIDNREAVFNNNEFIDLSNANQLLLSLAMPQTTGLDCCNLKAEICIKVIIRDNLCCEQEVLKCFTVDLK